VAWLRRRIWQWPILVIARKPCIVSAAAVTRGGASRWRIGARRNRNAASCGGAAWRRRLASTSIVVRLKRQANDNLSSSMTHSIVSLSCAIGCVVWPIVQKYLLSTYCHLYHFVRDKVFSSFAYSSFVIGIICHCCISTCIFCKWYILCILMLSSAISPRISPTSFSLSLLLFGVCYLHIVCYLGIYLFSHVVVTSVCCVLLL